MQDFRSRSRRLRCWEKANTTREAAARSQRGRTRSRGEQTPRTFMGQCVIRHRRVVVERSVHVRRHIRPHHVHHPHLVLQLLPRFKELQSDQAAVRVPGIDGAHQALPSHAASRSTPCYYPIRQRLIPLVVHHCCTPILRATSMHEERTLAQPHSHSHTRTQSHRATEPHSHAHTQPHHYQRQPRTPGAGAAGRTAPEAAGGTGRPVMCAARRENPRDCACSRFFSRRFWFLRAALLGLLLLF